MEPAARKWPGQGVLTRALLIGVAALALRLLYGADAARLVRLRHLGMLHVVQAPDETKAALAMVTEPLFASVSNALGCLDKVGKVPKELKGMLQVFRLD